MNTKKEWKPPADAKVVIVCAAVRYQDTIIPSARHFDANMRNLLKLILGPDCMKASHKALEQGFIDQWNRFYTREEAWRIVHKSGQPFNKDRNRVIGDLYSEGLY